LSGSNVSKRLDPKRRMSRHERGALAGKKLFQHSLHLKAVTNIVVPFVKYLCNII
jgi:hypothetical protein